MPIYHNVQNSAYFTFYIFNRKIFRLVIMARKQLYRGKKIVNLSGDIDMGQMSTFPLEYDDDTLIGGSAIIIDDKGIVAASNSQ